MNRPRSDPAGSFRKRPARRRSTRKHHQPAIQSHSIQMALALCLLFLLCGISGVLSQPWKRHSDFKDNTCPKGWSLLGSHCYIYQRRETTFADAESVCKIFGANLVSIHNAQENAFVLELIRRGGNNVEVWIGLHNAIPDNDFVWTDGTFVDFKAFSGAEPDGTGNCVLISESDGFWQDELCDEKASYVCIQDAKFCSDCGHFAL
ncbi:galactose-specific lectin nattectin-like [Vanacampus margaritifer]